jgi:hypothetical protein
LTATFGINDRVNETLGISVELEITPQASDVIKEILSFLICGGSRIVKTLNQTSFYMRRMVRFQVEISASVGGFPVDFVGQCCLFPDDQSFKKAIALSASISIVKWMDGLELLRWLRNSRNRSGS